MTNEKYITVSQYASIKGITKQAVYKQLNGKLKNFLIVVDGKKYIDIAALNENEIERLNNFEQPLNQPLNNFEQPFLENQILEKDKIIENLLRQIESLNEQNKKLVDSIQEQNNKLTELLKNDQILLATEKKLYIEQETSQEKEKKGFLSWFKRK